MCSAPDTFFLLPHCCCYCACPLLLFHACSQAAGRAACQLCVPAGLWWCGVPLHWTQRQAKQVRKTTSTSWCVPILETVVPQGQSTTAHSTVLEQAAGGGANKLCVHACSMTLHITLRSAVLCCDDACRFLKSLGILTGGPRVCLGLGDAFGSDLAVLQQCNAKVCCHDFCRFLKFLGILTLESFCSSALGLAVGAVAPSTDAAVAIGPAVMLVWIIFGGYYCNTENIPRCVLRARVRQQSSVLIGQRHHLHNRVCSAWHHQVCACLSSE